MNNTEAESNDYQICPNQRQKACLSDLSEKQFVALLMSGFALGRDFSSLIKKIRNETKKEIRTLLKQSLPCILISTRVKNNVETKNIIQYNYRIALDFDEKENPRFKDPEAFEKIIAELRADPYVRIGFITASEIGYKTIIYVSSGQEYHKQAFDILCDYVKKKYGLNVDVSGSDLVRNASGSIDKNPIYNPDSTIFEIIIPAQAERIAKSPKDESEPVLCDAAELAIADELLEIVEAGKIDTTSSDYKLGFGMAMFLGKWGEENRARFHRWSVFDPGYDKVKCDSLFDYAISKNQGKFTIATLLCACKKAGINIGKYTTGRFPKELDDDNPPYTTPLFPQEVYAHLPLFFTSKLPKYGDNHRQRDMWLISAIVAISSVTINVNVFYGGKSQSANLFLLITSPPASRKAAMIDARDLVLCVDKYIYDKCLLAKREFERRKKEEEVEPWETPPVAVRLIYPMNTSSSGLLKRLQYVAWGILLTASELDSFLKNSGEGWSSISDFLRMAFHNELYSITRNDYEIVIDLPRASALLSGTPDQALAFLPSTGNGLFSRLMIYSHADNDNWDNSVFDASDLLPAPITDKVFTLLELYQFLEVNPLATFNWVKPEHKTRLNSKHKEWLNTMRSIVGNTDTDATIKRLGLICTRIACVLTVIRLFEQNYDAAGISLYTIPEQFTCNDDDFETALSIVDTLKEHSLFLYENMQAKGNRKMSANHSILMKFYDLLPPTFTRKDILNSSMEDLRVSERSIGNYLKKLCDDGLLTATENFGVYTKIS